MAAGVLQVQPAVLLRVKPLDRPAGTGGAGQAVEVGQQLRAVGVELVV
jgi:hypothetical protein